MIKTFDLSCVQAVGKDANLLLIEINNLYYYLDKLGNISGGFSYATDYSEGYAVVMVDNLFYFRDIYGNLSKNGYKKAWGFKEGFGAVQIENSWHFLDKNFKLSKPFDRVGLFKNGYGKVFDKGLWFYYDKFGNLSKNGRSLISSFYEGIAFFKQGEEYFFVDENGNVSSDSYKKIDGLGFTNGYMAVVVGDKWFLRDKFGVLHTKGYDRLGRYKNQLVSAFEDGKWFFVDINDKKSKPFEDVKDFSEGFGLVKIKKWHYIDSNKKIIKKGFDDASSFKDGFAEVVDNQVKFYIDANFVSYSKEEYIKKRICDFLGYDVPFLKLNEIEI